MGCQIWAELAMWDPCQNPGWGGERGRRYQSLTLLGTPGPCTYLEARGQGSPVTQEFHYPLVQGVQQKMGEELEAQTNQSNPSARTHQDHAAGNVQALLENATYSTSVTLFLSFCIESSESNSAEEF